MALRLVPVVAEDFEELLALRIAAMQDSLERAGIFDPERARQRFLGQFDPASTWHIERLTAAGPVRAGLLTLKVQDGFLRLEHLYIHPRHQNQGVGTWALAQAKSRAREEGLDLSLAALRISDANRFYQRHGLRAVSSTELDTEYRWSPEGDRA
ncbi:GNAT family N-acetyltransferase [Pelomonas sp. BJYL3]|uniref:GNAT family N-acetyltransferase n=1 Tax=Pelomonas sp. BJYL3 TaxID=2976697 RepID=UPI0022B49D8F|nr:GNAT family N-acetyltransferase [Pelomonas sp. BJYL3]